MTTTHPDTLFAVQAATRTETRGISYYNLLNDFNQLGTLLEAELRAYARALTQAPSAGNRGSEAAYSQAASQAYDHVLNTLLLAAGMNQIVEDYLHRQTGLLDKVTRRLEGSPRAQFRTAARLSRKAQELGEVSRRFMANERRTIQWQRELASFLQQAAEEVVRLGNWRPDSGQPSPRAVRASTETGSPISDSGARLVASIGQLPDAVIRSVVRLPSCFRSFDQHPADCWRLVELFHERWPDRDRPVMVVGLRTSGSYLAPLYAACLRAHGYRGAQALTMRPGQPWLPDEMATIARLKGEQGLAVLVDDPPFYGGAVATAASELQALGIPKRSIVLLMQTFDVAETLPARLREYQAVLLPWTRWTIHERLAPEAVRATLAALLVGNSDTGQTSSRPATSLTVVAVKSVEPVPPTLLDGLKASPPFRAHIRARYRACVEDAAGELHDLHVYVKGVGLGYFGEHALSITDRLPDFLPQTYGIRDGLLFREWLPAEARVATQGPGDPLHLGERVATYIAARSDALSLAEDISERLRGRDPVWQLSGDLLCHSFGRLEPIVRPLVYRVVRRLLRVEHPSVVDGGVGPAEWFRVDDEEREDARQAGNRLRKVNYDEHAFSNEDKYCFDATFDLAAAAVDYEESGGDAHEEFTHTLRASYRALTGRAIEDERWLLYQLIHILHDLRYLQSMRSRIKPGVVDAVMTRRQLYGAAARDNDYQGAMSLQVFHEATGGGQRAMSRRFQRYIGDLVFADITPAASGPLCAIDIDGVLETGSLSFPAITPAGALALRALARHGYRPILATGRSESEVLDRCAAYRLAGGVAEYGAVIYNHLSGRCRTLLTTDERSTLERLRAALCAHEGVYLDQSYRHAIRAYRINRHGWRACLSDEVVQSALAQAACAGAVRPIQGKGQTDFMVTRVEKGVGIRELARELGEGAEQPDAVPELALAVGDTESDLPMFALAARAFAPANADATLRGALPPEAKHLRIMPRPFQVGLHAAVAATVGHRPGSCDTCALPPLSQHARLMLTMLAAQDSGKPGKLMQALLLLARSMWLRDAPEHRYSGGTSHQNAT